MVGATSSDGFFCFYLDLQSIGHRSVTSHLPTQPSPVRFQCHSSIDRWYSSLGHIKMLLPFFTGYEHLGASSLNWLSSSIEFSTALLLGVCLISSDTSLIYRREVDFVRQLPDFLTSALHDSSLSVTAHSLLLDHGFGTA